MTVDDLMKKLRGMPKNAEMYIGDREDDVSGAIEAARHRAPMGRRAPAKFQHTVA